MIDTDSDWDLVNRATVDRQAIETLFKRYKDYVYRLAYAYLSEKALAEDTVQAVFLKLQEKKFKLKPEAKFTTWLYQFALNTARENGRKRKNLGNTNEDIQDKEYTSVVQNDMSDGVINFHDLTKALGNLPGRQREIFILRYLEGFNTQETSEIVGCKQGTVKTHLARATKSIEQQFSKNSSKSLNTVTT